MVSEQAFIIYSGNNQRAIVAFCREAVTNQIPFYIISSGENDSIYLTDYKKFVIHERSSRSLSVNELIECTKSVKQQTRVKKLFVLPSSEYLNRFLLDHRAALLDENIHIPLVNKSLYSKISDKDSFADLCASYELKVPELLEYSTSLKPPFVVKPKKYFNKQGAVQFKPILVLTDDDLIRFKESASINEFFLQEYVKGESYYLLMYLSKNGAHVCHSQKNILQQAEGGSIIAATTSSIHKQNIADSYLKLLKSIGFWGMIMIELRCQNKQYFMIEANPRLWGPSQLFVDANIPIFTYFFADLGFEVKPKTKEITSANYFWHGGLVENQKRGKQLINHISNLKVSDFDVNNWSKVDVYNRIDTIAVYKKELDE